MAASNKSFTVDAATGAKSKPERRWILKNQGKHFCECGCGEAIEIIRQHRYERGIPCFLPGHRTKKWIQDHQGKHLCQCGCGQAASITKLTKRSGRGIPRFIRGHSTKLRYCIDKWVEQNQGRHFCSCGCGQTIPITKHTKSNGIPEMLQGHKRLLVGLWVDRESGKHFCGCDCGKPIKILPDHRKRGIPRFIHGHNAVGSSNPSWKGGTSKTYASHRGRLQPKDWPQRVLERDGHKCQWPECGSTERLHAHHLIPFSKDPSIVGELWNGITLCETCHYKVKGHELDYAEFFLNLLRRGA